LEDDGPRTTYSFSYANRHSNHSRYQWIHDRNRILIRLLPHTILAPKERGISNYDDEEESEDEDIDESILDHAPNWGNGLEADKRDGLRATKAKEEPVKTGWEDSTEECKLVLVVRTDLGMTKGRFPLPSSSPDSSMSNVDFSR
jgi:hypothetical protein